MIARFDTLIEIVIAESASLVSNEVVTINIIANKAIANVVTILLKTRLI